MSGSRTYGSDLVNEDRAGQALTLVEDRLARLPHVSAAEPSWLAQAYLNAARPTAYWPLVRQLGSDDRTDQAWQEQHTGRFAMLSALGSDSDEVGRFADVLREYLRWPLWNKRYGLAERLYLLQVLELGELTSASAFGSSIETTYGDAFPDVMRALTEPRWTPTPEDPVDVYPSTRCGASSCG